MEVLSILGLGVKAKWRAGLRKSFASELPKCFSPHALDLLTDEAIVYIFKGGRRPTYGDAEYLVDRLRDLHSRLVEAGAVPLESGAIGVREIHRLRAEGKVIPTRQRPPWG